MTRRPRWSAASVNRVILVRLALFVTAVVAVDLVARAQLLGPSLSVTPGAMVAQLGTEFLKRRGLSEPVANRRRGFDRLRHRRRARSAGWNRAVANAARLAGPRADPDGVLRDSAGRALSDLHRPDGRRTLADRRDRRPERVRGHRRKHDDRLAGGSAGLYLWSDESTASHAGRWSVTSSSRRAHRSSSTSG